MHLLPRMNRQNFMCVNLALIQAWTGAGGCANKEA
jgi:hypothetical protein